MIDADAKVMHTLRWPRRTQTSEISLHRILGIEKRLLQHPRGDEESIDGVVVVLHTRQLLFGDKTR